MTRLKTDGLLTEMPSKRLLMKYTQGFVDRADFPGNLQVKGIAARGHAGNRCSTSILWLIRRHEFYSTGFYITQRGCLLKNQDPTVFSWRVVFSYTAKLFPPSGWNILFYSTACVLLYTYSCKKCIPPLLLEFRLMKAKNGATAVLSATSIYTLCQRQICSSRVPLG